MKTLLRRIRSVLLAIGIRIGRINNFILLAISFYLLMFPLSLVRRLIVRGDKECRWLKREPLPPDHFEKQY